MTPRKIIGRLGIEPCAPNAYPSPGINAGVSRRFLMTQAPARGIGRAVWIIAPTQQRLGIDMLVASVVGEQSDATLVVHPVVVVSLVIGRIAQLDLPWQHRHSQGTAVANELAALIRASRIGGIAQRQF